MGRCKWLVSVSAVLGLLTGVEAQIENDTCDTATPISVGEYEFDSSQATTSGVGVGLLLWRGNARHYP